MVVGLGSLGGAVAGQAARFGMQVVGVRTRAEPHPDCARVVAVPGLDAELPGAEFLVLATPLTDATRGLLDRRRIGLLPAGAGVVNIGRGALVEQDALCDALDVGALGGAVLDVFVPEPVPPGHRLWGTRNLVMTPHVSADDPKTYNPNSLDIFFRNLRALRTVNRCRTDLTWREATERAARPGTSGISPSGPASAPPVRRPLLVRPGGRPALRTGTGRMRDATPAIPCQGVLALSGRHHRADTRGLLRTGEPADRPVTVARPSSSRHRPVPDTWAEGVGARDAGTWWRASQVCAATCPRWVEFYPWKHPGMLPRLWRQT